METIIFTPKKNYLHDIILIKINIDFTDIKKNILILINTKIDCTVCPTKMILGY